VCVCVCVKSSPVSSSLVQSRRISSNLVPMSRRPIWQVAEPSLKCHIRQVVKSSLVIITVSRAKSNRANELKSSRVESSGASSAPRARICRGRLSILEIAEIAEARSTGQRMLHGHLLREIAHLSGELRPPEGAAISRGSRCDLAPSCALGRRRLTLGTCLIWARGAVERVHRPSLSSSLVLLSPP